MSKTEKCDKQISAEEAFEIIELASGDIEVLARAFQLITEVCEEVNNPNLVLESAPEKQTLH